MMSKEQLNAEPPESARLEPGTLVLSNDAEIEFSGIDDDGDVFFECTGSYLGATSLRELADYLNALATWIEKGGR